MVFGKISATGDGRIMWRKFTGVSEDLVASFLRVEELSAPTMFLRNVG